MYFLLLLNKNYSESSVKLITHDILHISTKQIIYINLKQQFNEWLNDTVALDFNY